MKRFLLSVALLLACSGVALAQESEFSGGGGGGITAAPGSGTVNVLPRFASATSVVDSPFVVGGTAAAPVLHFSLSGVVGITSPAIYATTSNIALRNGADTGYVVLTAADIASTYNASSGIGGGWADAAFTSFRAVANKGDVGTFQIGSTGAYNFGSTTGNQRTEVPDTGIARSAAGILAVTDGSTGQGGIGLSDAATNTVTDALILRHATSGTAAASFGTGLLFQGEDASGNMQDMASIDAVYTDATNGSEDTEIWLNTFAAGAEVTAMVFSQDRIRANTLTLDAIDGSTGVLYLATGGTSRWFVQSAPNGGGLLPFADNTYNFGYPTLKIKDAYLGTSIQGTRTQAISDNAAAATFVTIAVPTSNTTVGGRIFYTITAIDAGTAIQTKTGTYSFGLNNIGGTVTGAGTDVLEHSQLSTGTLAPTFSVNISGTNAQFQLVLDTSLDAGAETLKIEYRVQVDSGTATVTPAT